MSEVIWVVAELDLEFGKRTGGLLGAQLNQRIRRLPFFMTVELPHAEDDKKRGHHGRDHDGCNPARPFQDRGIEVRAHEQERMARRPLTAIQPSDSG